MAAGDLIDSPARDLLLIGKGAALAKGARDVRPIVTLHPLLQMAGHCLVTEHRNAIKEVVGDEQLMGTSAGPEILVHMLQHAHQARLIECFQLYSRTSCNECCRGVNSGTGSLHGNATQHESHPSSV